MTDVQGKRVARTYTMTLRANPERVFPLLCPVREHDYLDDWNATILYSDSGVAEPGCVFQTPNDSSEPTTWYISRHDAETGTIRFVTFTPPSRVGQLDVQVQPTTGDATEATFTYTHTAIIPAGREFIAAFTEQAFREKMKTLERKLNAFLHNHGGE